MKVSEILESLKGIIEAKSADKLGLIKEFQNAIWNDESIKDETLNNLLSDLAYNLDFYEPDKDRQSESLSFYGLNQLKITLEKGVETLNTYLNSPHL